MMFESIYKVTRADYISFLEQIKPDCRKIEVKEIDPTHTATKIFSKNTGKCLCSRLTYTAEYGNPEPEIYYIFEMPEDYERLPPIPKIKITLDSKEEVQKFFDYFAQKQKKENNKND